MRPIIGHTRDDTCSLVINVLKNKISKLTNLNLPAGKMLDVGCGEGAVTRELGKEVGEIFALDILRENLLRFRKALLASDFGFRIHLVQGSAANLPFKNSAFDRVVTVETIEHLQELEKSFQEMCRVLKEKEGELIISCPNRLFPFENHGVRLLGRVIPGRVPLLPYIPPLHNRFSLARVFTVRRLDKSLSEYRLKRMGLDYVFPTFEHGGNPLQKFLRPLRKFMRYLEASPVKIFGSSIIVVYRKLGGEASV
jgi:SAM-dependent methyltransferase